MGTPAPLLLSEDQGLFLKSLSLFPYLQKENDTLYFKSCASSCINYLLSAYNMLDAENTNRTDSSVPWVGRQSKKAASVEGGTDCDRKLGSLRCYSLPRMGHLTPTWGWRWGARRLPKK